METIKVGDTVRVSKAAPEIYRKTYSMKIFEHESEVCDVEDGMAIIWTEPIYKSIIPTKYLVKVGGEEKEPRFKYHVGDKVILHFYGGEVSTITDAFNDGSVWNKYRVKAFDNRVWNENELDPYTEPTEEKKPLFHFGDIVRFWEIGEPMRSGRVVSERSNFNLYTVCSGIDFFSVDEEALNPYDPIKDGYISPIEKEPTEKKDNTITIPVKAEIDDSFWDAYTADLAKEIITYLLRQGGRIPDFDKLMQSAIRNAKSVVEELKKK